MDKKYHATIMTVIFLLLVLTSSLSATGITFKSFQKSQNRYIKFTANYPVFSQSGDWASVNEIIEAYINNQSKDFMKILDAKVTEQLKDSSAFPYVKDIDISLVRCDDVILSLLARTYEYTGGAHGNTGFKAFNFVIKDNVCVKIDLDDMVSGKHKRQMQTIVSKLLSALNAQQAQEDDFKPSLDIFTITPTGLEFHYSPYEVDCYAAGDFHVLVPFNIVRLYPKEPLLK